MADTTLAKIRDTESTNLSDATLNQLIEDAKTMILAQGWDTAISDFNSNHSRDIEEPIQRYLVLHLAKVDEHEISSDSSEGKSVDFDTPSGDIMEFLRNTRPGRRVAKYLNSIGISPQTQTRTAPRTF